jgi:glycosyltransferase involved in cell wall biosynthesis
VFNFYAWLFEQRDLAWLKRWGKGVCVTFQGDDARPGGDKWPGADRIKAKRVAMFSRYADRIYALNPDLLNHLPSWAEFMPYASVDLSEYVVQNVPGRREIPVVVHAPSDREAKGTQRIIDAVNYLHSQGVMFTFNLIENRTRAEVKEALNQADLVIDQVLCGWYGAVAVEAMALGKPVVCYICSQNFVYIPNEMRPLAVVSVPSPFVFAEILELWLSPYYLQRHIWKRGQESRAFVEAHHDPLKIAARLKRDYEEVLG